MDAADLVEIEAIKTLKYRYVRCLDLKLWDEIAHCFVGDATASYGGGAHEFTGRDAIVGFLRDAMGSEGFLSSHRVGQPEIELTGAGEARGRWALDDVVVHTDLGVTIRGSSFYEDTYVKEAGEWKIASTGYRRVFEEIEPRSDAIRITASWWGTDGRSTLLDS